MRFFALPQNVFLDTNLFQRQYLGSADLQTLPLERLYLDIGNEAQLISQWLALNSSSKDGQTPVLRFIKEEALLGLASFPARLGRVSTRAVGDKGLHIHLEKQPLPVQLQALQARKSGQQHFRFAIANGFGGNLGDCTVGVTVLRVVLRHLREHLPSVSCDVLFGPDTSISTVNVLCQEREVEQVRFHNLTVAEFAQYDAYFDFTNLTHLPYYNEMPTVDWLLWWCGLAPDAVPAEHKRNQGHIRQDAWQAVQALLRHRPGQKVLFNPKASVPLRSMPEDVALQCAKRLLALDPQITLVIDQPLPLKHQRLVDLSGKITTPEMFKALVGQMDGVITVDTFAIHQADVSSTPCVTLFSSIAPTAYPYYPYNAGLGIPGYEALPAYQRPKVADEEWAQIKDAYHAAWARLNPAQVLALLREKMAQRQAHPNEPARLTVGPPVPSASCVVLDGSVPRLKRQRLAPEHAYASERFAHLTQSWLKPGSVCVMACAPDARLALALAERMAPHGELIVLEPRAPLARNVEAALHLAGSPCTARVLQAVSLGGAAQANIHVLQPWSESHSSEWGNLPAVITVPSQPVDALALARCNALLVQSPMPYELFINGALETLKRCRPLVLMTPVSRAQATAVLQAAQAAHYDFWVETALPHTQPATAASASAWLLVGVPRERPVQMAGFTPLRLE